MVGLRQAMDPRGQTAGPLIKCESHTSRVPDTTMYMYLCVTIYTYAYIILNVYLSMYFAGRGILDVYSCFLKEKRGV